MPSGQLSGTRPDRLFRTVHRNRASQSSRGPFLNLRSASATTRSAASDRPDRIPAQGLEAALTVNGRDPTCGTIEFAAKFGHVEPKAAWGKFNADVLVAAVMVGGPVRISLGKDDLADRPAMRTAQAPSAPIRLASQGVRPAMKQSTVPTKPFFRSHEKILK
jgi:hypothetical protein